MNPLTMPAIARERQAPSLRFMQPTLPDWEDVASLYREVYKSGLITNGELVERLESVVAERLRVKHCVAVSSCTSGLMLVFKALGIAGEVIVPSFTFFASGEALLWNGIRPVFADCEPDTWNIDPLDVARRITSRTTAILGVHMYGNPADTESLSRIASRSDVKLIFDSAHAFGSSQQGKPIGTFGDAEVFSLSPANPLAAGEGGLVTTDDSFLARRLRAARNYGDLGAYDPELQGLNARMSEFNAALAISGVPLLKKKIIRHNEIAQLYIRLLSDLPGITFQHIRGDNVSTYKDFSIHILANRKLSSDRLCYLLHKRSVPTKRHYYPPLHQQKIFSSYHHSTDLPLPVTEHVSEGVVSLPIYDSLSDQTITSICSEIRDIVLNDHQQGFEL
jgi:dTDP-4-amino-4,6-dideoxygalactose transaminase